MRKVLGLSLALVVALTTMASGKPVDKTTAYRPELPNLGTEQQSSGSASLSSHLFTDTFSYGGTVWDNTDGRWEAIRDSYWTFQTGIASSINTGGNPNKPVGYHEMFEGWYGIDQTLNPMTYFSRTSLCAITGSFSLHAGVSAAQATTLCYVAGQGYGNSWGMTMSKNFTYGGSGNVGLAFQYAVDAEPGFDYAYVAIDTTGNGSQDDVLIVDYTGSVSGSASLTLTEGTDMRSDAGDFTLKLIASSDGGYSDEDGLYPTVCGHSTFDNIVLSGGATGNDTFESGADGWVLEVPTTGVGDFTDIVPMSTLPPPVAFCPCGLADSVLVFFDETFQHPLDQDNIAASPWVDLAAADLGKAGRLMLYDVYAEMPLANYIFVQLRARYYPWTCPYNGNIDVSPWKDQNTVFYFGETPFCNPSNAPRARDYSAVIEAGATEMQLGFGALSLCRTAPFGTPCTGLSNTTPWMDNIFVGIYGNSTAPNVQTTTFDRFQDNFAADGTLNPASAGRLDVNRIKNNSIPATGSILGDTLVTRGDGGNTEVRLVFRVRSGPFTNAGALAAQAAKWTSEPTLNARYGGNWYSARMDTAEQGGARASAQWMTTFHESDPGFTPGADTVADPNDPNRAPRNDILPDNLFTPGSRIDYFTSAKYNDSRNPGGLFAFTDPDTHGAFFREVEILPSSMAADSSWNCTLYVDHHDDRNLFDQAAEEQGLRLSLGLGGNNAENTKHDRYDDQTPSSGQASFGRPLETTYGASQVQVFAYKNIAWHAATLSSGDLTNEDAAILNPWLRSRTVSNNRLWVSGAGMATSMHNVGVGTPARVFLNSTLGATRTCDTIRLAACPTGTVLDTTYCLPMTSVASSHFNSSVIPYGRGNGCPDLESFDLLGLSTLGVGTVNKGQLSYIAKGATRNYMSVTNWNTLDFDFKTVIDGTSVGRLRANAGYYNVGCSDVTASYARTDDVLDWFASALSCKKPAGLVDVPLPEGPSVPTFRHALGNAYPNPMNPATTIQFTNGINNGHVSLQIFDVTGRLVKTLVDGKLTAGAHEVSWDGSDNAGHSAPNGMYFYRMSADNFVSAKKIVMMRQ